MAITWTNEGGVLEVLIGRILQARVVNVEKSQTISGQNRFLVGGSDESYKNFLGAMFEVNLWDSVLDPSLIFMMFGYIGNDRGNVVASKNFTLFSPNHNVTNLNNTIQQASKL